MDDGVHAFVSNVVEYLYLISVRDRVAERIARADFCRSIAVGERYQVVIVSVLGLTVAKLLCLPCARVAAVDRTFGSPPPSPASRST